LAVSPARTAFFQIFGGSFHLQGGSLRIQ
jgi:hypothetical protein